jgi:lipoprotein-releasing system permease protein
MLFSKRGSLIGAVLAVTIGILVLHVNSVIFQGLFDAIIRDISNYQTGDVLITSEEGYIDESDAVLLGTLERIPYVEAAAPRLSTAATMTISKNGQSIEEFRVPLTGVDPLRDVRASTIHETVVEGQYVFARNSMVLGAIVARDMGGAQVGDSIEVTVTDRWGQEQTRRFIVTGIARSPGGQGFDYTAIVHIDTLRDMLDRAGSSERIMVKLSDKSKALEVKNTFLLSFPNGDLEAQTIEEAAEQQLAGFRSGIAMINMIGYFGMMSSAFAILTIQMMLVNGKTREIGIMRSIGAKRRDVLLVFILQGMIIGAIGASVGTAAGLGYTFYAKETKLSFNNSLPLEVSYNWEKIIQTALASFGLAMLASLYPSYRATKLQPVEAMRLA